MKDEYKKAIVEHEGAIRKTFYVSIGIVGILILLLVYGFIHG